MNTSDSRPAHANTAERRTILDAIPVIAWCKLPDGSNEFVNQRWQDYTGIPADEARGQGWQAAVHPEATGSPRSDVEPDAHAYTRLLRRRDEKAR